jgi:hypothetical protein
MPAKKDFIRNTPGGFSSSDVECRQLGKDAYSPRRFAALQKGTHQPLRIRSADSAALFVEIFTLPWIAFAQRAVPQGSGDRLFAIVCK